MNTTIKTFTVALFAVVMMAGCATDTEYVNRYKDIPVAVYGEPVEAADVSEELKEQYDNLPIYNITEESSNQEVIVAWVQSLIIATSYADQLEEAVKPFQDLNNE